MRTLKSLVRWTPLVILIFALVLALSWEDRLALSPLDHNLLAVGSMVIFYLLANSWIDANEEYLITTQHNDPFKYEIFIDDEDNAGIVHSPGRAE